MSNTELIMSLLEAPGMPRRSKHPGYCGPPGHCGPGCVLKGRSDFFSSFLLSAMTSGCVRQDMDLRSFHFGSIQLADWSFHLRPFAAFFQWIATYSYHVFLSTPSIVDPWEMRGKAVNSRNANILANSGRLSTELSTEITSGIWPRQITLAIFYF